MSMGHPPIPWPLYPWRFVWGAVAWMLAWLLVVAVFCGYGKTAAQEVVEKL